VIQDPTSPSEIRAVFDQVLASEEFTPPGSSPLETVLRWMGDGLEWIFEQLFPSGPIESSTVMTWIVVALALVALRMLVVRLGRGRFRARRERETPVAPRDAAAWIRWARMRAGEGSLREAATGVYQAVVHHMAEKGAVRHQSWKTPGDYVDEMARDPALRQRFTHFLGDFLVLAFGPVPPTREEVAALEEHARSLGVRA
jgi:hypothetical protein